MKVEVSWIGVEMDQVDSCHLDLVRFIMQELRNRRPLHFIHARSRSTRRELSNSLGSPWFDERYRVLAKVPLVGNDYPLGTHSSIKFDYVASCRQHSLQQHSVGIEICLDNRIALGTNLWLGEVFSANESVRGHRPFIIYITLGARLLDLGGWDAAYINDELFKADVRYFYAPHLKQKAVMISLDLD